MEIQFSNQLQVKIADLIWNAESKDDVKNIIKFFGHDGVVVYHMIMAHYFDEDDCTYEAAEILENIFRNKH